MHGIKSGDFEALLQKKYPGAYKENQVQDPGAGTPKIVEATGDGVSLVALKTTASADSLAVLRPRLPKLAKARAVLRAFHYKGRPYDFDFDFRTDSKLVCTELIYKAYEPEPHIAGLMLPLQEILGREVMTANDLVRLFDKEYETETRQLDLVVFLDGDETDKKAYLNTPQAFRKSWKRPKWHILVADDALSQE